MLKHNKLITLVLAVSAGNVFAHGYQTAPYSRTAYLVDSGQVSRVEYNPNQISNNLTAEFGTKNLTQINSYQSTKNNGSGPLAFYKDNYPIQDNRLCGYVANSQTKYFEALNTSLPDIAMTKVSPGSDVQFSWIYSAWHSSSNKFVFITKYPAGKYKPNPSWADLNLVCAVSADATITNNNRNNNWKCKLPQMSGDAKQVMVTIWQRVDAGGENFISCADVKVDGGTVVPPEEIWSILNKAAGSWPAPLATTATKPKAGETVTFELFGTKNGVKSVVETYTLAVTSSNINNWEFVLANKINSDTSQANLITIGELTSSGSIVYNQTDKTKNFVYLNHTTSDPSVQYSFNMTKKQTPTPVVNTWTPVGNNLNTWVNSTLVKTGDKLVFALQVNGIEETIPEVVATSPTGAEAQVANAINNHAFKNSLSVRTGVLSNSTVNFVTGGNNKVYVYRPADDTRTISYVVRTERPIEPTPTPTVTPSPSTYPVYPTGMGSYKMSDLVTDSTKQKVYACVQPNWCNMPQYSLTTGAWKEVKPKAAPSGYKTFPIGQPYTAGSVVADIEGNLFKCTVAGWCNQGGVYTPGIGTFWSAAWVQQ